jgi:predicted RNase H-like HicB family nuclease
VVAVTVYKVIAAREGDKWTADVPEVPGAHTWARGIQGLEAGVREVIALVLDLPEGAESTLELDWQYSTGDAAWDEATAALRAARRGVDAMAVALADQTTLMAVELVRSFSVRDIAALLGVSYQRVSQIAPRKAEPVMKPAAKAAARRPHVKAAKRALPAKLVARKGAVKKSPARRRQSA